MKRRLWDMVFLLTIAALLSFFFLPLFYPTQQIIATPDFGTIDAFHSSLAMKYVEWLHFHDGSIPLWSSLIGGGQPLLPDAIGVFYLPNIVFLSVFPFVTGYNLFLIFSVILFGWGMYLWIRSIGLHPISAFFTGITGSLSGIMIPRLTHIMIIPSLSLLPWVLVATHLLLTQKSLKKVAFFAFILGEQILSSFPQTTCLTLMIAVSYALFLWYSKKTDTYGVVTMILAILLALGFSAVQLLPSWEFHRESISPQGFTQDVASYFSYPLVHLKTFLDPFNLGNPKNGTYPPFWSFNGSIFWENSGYVGLLPLFLIFVLSVYLIGQRHIKERKFCYYLFSLLLFAFLLMLGNKSPLYFLYSFPPLNIFRTPSRFLWVFVFALLTLSSIAFHHIWIIKKKKWIIIRFLLLLALGIHIFILFTIWKPYHALVSASEWLHKPEIVNTIDPHGRIFSVGMDTIHNQTFTSKGWESTEPYRFLRNGLAPNINLFWSLSSIKSYSGLSLRRRNILEGYLETQIHTDKAKLIITPIGKKLLDVLSAKTILAAVPVTMDQAVQGQSVTDGKVTITVWNNPDAVKRGYLAEHAVTVKTLPDIARAFASKTFVPKKTVLTETPLSFDKPSEKTTITIDESKSNSHISVRLDGVVGTNLFVLSDTYYPGWKATVDGRMAPIYPINIMQRGILIPTGNHSVVFEYAPITFIYGSALSIISAFILILLWVWPIRTPYLSISEVSGHRSLHRQDNPGM